MSVKHKSLWILGCLSGGFTVVMGAAGGHKHEWPIWKKQFQSEATKYGLTTSLATMMSACVSRTIYPGIFLILGNVLFTGPLYYRCHTDSTNFNKALPFGGTSLILGYTLMAFL